MKLIIIDVQKGITDDRLYKFESFVENVRILIETARKNNIEIIYVQHDDGEGSGFSVGDEDFEIYDKVAPKDNEKSYIKTVNSCFGNKEFAKYLEYEKEDTLMIAGLQTNFCIDASIKSAFDRGYKVIVPRGANSTFDNEYMNGEATCKYYNEFIWKDRFADCIAMDEAVALLKSHNNI